MMIMVVRSLGLYGIFEMQFSIVTAGSVSNAYRTEITTLSLSVPHEGDPCVRVELDRWTNSCQDRVTVPGEL